MQQKEFLPAPKTYGEAMALAEGLSKSELIPKHLRGKPADVFVCMMWGHSLGIPTVQAMQSIAVINGKPALYGDGLLAVVTSSGLLDDIREESYEEGGKLAAKCTVKRKGRASPFVSIFTQADAEKAGLWGKTGPWQSYPKRMLKMRARAFALRDAFPDVLSGMSSAEEQRDVIDAEPAEAETIEVAAPVQAPTPKMPRRLPKAVADSIGAEDDEDVEEIEDAEEEAAAEEPAAPAEEVPDEAHAYPAAPAGVLDRIQRAATPDEVRKVYKTLSADLRADKRILDLMKTRVAELNGGAK